ncbi:MAG: hypothetical protein E7K72_25505 [Roseomonas mucosa]|nr:hypothetical protein [Roseomonas mucosa]
MPRALIFARPPTPAQKEAGNYRMERLNYGGLRISIENPRGSVREGVDKGGNRWSTGMAHHYGYIRGTLGVDGDHFDVLVGPHPNAPTVWLANTMAPPDFTQPDEQKAMLGFMTEHQARAAFLAMYDDPRFLKDMTEMPFAEFKAKVMTTRQDPRMLKGLLLAFRRASP